jgi:hypothetical protein
MIRVAGRTFTSDCRDEMEAAKVAKSIRTELARHFEEELGGRG